MGEDPKEVKAALRAVPTFAKFVEEDFLPHIKMHKRSWECDVSLLNNHLLPALGHLHMDIIARRDVQRLITSRLDMGKAPGTCDRMLILARHIFNCAIKWKTPGVKSNPAKEVDLLKVEHILVVGHYGCSGVHASLTGTRVGLADNWLRHVGDVAQKHAGQLENIELETLRHARLCELNVIEQVMNVCQTTIVEDAWSRGQELSVHGWVYSLLDGRVRQLGMDISGRDDLPAAYAAALVRGTGTADPA